MKTQVLEVEDKDIPQVASFLVDLWVEMQNSSIDQSKTEKIVKDAKNEDVTYFIFKDENGSPFGTCHLQSLHNYWDEKKRFYVAGFYIAPSHRGQGRFKDIYAQLVKWSKDNNGRQLFAYIHSGNEKSLKAFSASGMEEAEYKLYSHSL